MKKIPLYVALARTIAWKPPIVSEFVGGRAKRLKALVDLLPSGSGWDFGTYIDEDQSCEERIVLSGEFHHMDEWGGYDGWTSHEIHVKPSLRWGFEMRVTGKDRNGVKEYLHDLFHEALSEMVWEYDYATHGGFVVEDREGEPVEVVWKRAEKVWDVYRYDGGQAVHIMTVSSAGASGGGK